MRHLMGFHWPGNVRQLENAIERALALSPGRSHIDVGDLPPEVRRTGADEPEAPAGLPADGIDLRAHLQRIERDLIEAALERSGGNKQQAAHLLGIKRTTLVEKTKRLAS